MGKVIRFPSLADILASQRPRRGRAPAPRKLLPPMRSCGEGDVIVRIPLILQAETNKREHWAQRAKRSRIERETARRDMRISGGKLELPAVVTLTRFGPRKLDDDNLQTAFKHVRDGVADWMGLDDRNPVVSWLYRQVVGPVWGIEIRLQRRT